MLLLEQFENLTLHPKNAARLKELVLQLAVQGKLTENWRKQNLDVEPAAELLKCIEAEKAQLVKYDKTESGEVLEGPYQLPSSWAWCELGDIANVKSSKRIFASDYTEEGVPFYRSKEVGDLSRGEEIKKSLFIERGKYEELKSSFGVPNKGDLMLTSVGSIGNTWIVDNREFYYKDGNITLIEKNEFNYIPFINLFIKSPLFKSTVNNIVSGTAYNALPINKIKGLPLPLPPLAEQEAIVARVEELMQKIEELEKQTAERIQLKQHLGAAALQQLTAATDEELEQNWLFLKQHFQTMFDDAANVKKLRETILQLAVQGKLTTTWRKYNPTTEPASELLKRIQTEKAQLVKEKKIKKEKPLEPISEDEVPYALPEGWVWCRFQDIATVASNLVQPSVYLELPHIAPDNIEKHTGRLLAFKTVREDSLVSSKHLFYSGQILYSKIRPRLNKVVEIDFQGLCSADMYPVNCHIIRGYLFRYMLSDDFVLQSTANEGRVAMPKINQVELNKILVPVPPLAEQEAIVDKVDQLMQLCDELEQQIQQSKQETESLMQAVVQEALQVQVLAD